MVEPYNKERSFGLSAIGQIALPVRDLRRAVAYYRELLRVPFLFEAPPGLAFFDCAGIRLMLDTTTAQKTASGGSILYYRVEDIAFAYNTLKSRGIEFEDAPHLIHKFPDHELWMCFFRDSEGNNLALMSEIKQSSAS
jgi:methylmalonyl-CoA/ethylmalonyl-CoA epimerase